MRFTVLGSTGFVGSHLTGFLRSAGYQVYCPARDESLVGQNLGKVIYCIGLTADFRNKPFETIEAHVCKLRDVLQHADFDSFTYLSSTRVYIHNSETVNEDSLIPISVNDPFDLFNSSKLTGELLTLNCGRHNVKVVRLSNVIGDDFNSQNFLTSIIRDAFGTGQIILRTTPDSGKDYIGIHDVVRMLFEISAHGKQRVYNLASGYNTSNEDIVEVIKAQTNCTIEYIEKPERIQFPTISIDRMLGEFSFRPEYTALMLLEKIIANFKRNYSDTQYR